MKTLRFMACGLALLLLTSCNAVSSQSRNANPLVLTLEITQKEVHSFDDIQCQITLSNQSDTSVLVHRRLFSLPFPAVPPLAETLILISDSSGNLVANESLSPNYVHPSADTLGVLRPGDMVKKIIYLDGVGFWESLFKKGETYTIVAIYQNELDITKTIDGLDVSSWVGSVRSNAETFIILP